MIIIEDGKWTKEVTDQIVQFMEKIEQSHETFGQRLRRYRKAKGFSQRLLARNAGIDHTYLSKIENSKTAPPSYRTVKLLARCLDLDTVDLAILAGPRAALTARVHQLEEELLKTKEALQEATKATEFWRQRCHETEDKFGVWRPDVS